MEWFKGFVAVLIALTFTACFIGILHYTSFERHHTHTDVGQITVNQDDISKQLFIAENDEIKTLGTTQGGQTGDAYSSQKSLQHYDHKAQIFMAFLTLLGLLVTVGGLILIGKTLTATKAAAKAAADTLDIAQNTLDESKRVASSQLRPYITVLDGNITKYGESIGFDFDIKNFGQTAARNLRINTKVHIMGAQLAYKDILKYEGKKRILPTQSRDVMMPQEQDTVSYELHWSTLFFQMLVLVIKLTRP